MRVSVVVAVEGGASVKAVAVDISSDGLGIECDIRQRNMITPGGSYVRNGKPVSVVVDLELSDEGCLLYTSPSPRDKRQSRMPSSA